MMLTLMAGVTFVVLNNQQIVSYPRIQVFPLEKMIPASQVNLLPTNNQVTLTSQTVPLGDKTFRSWAALNPLVLFEKIKYGNLSLGLLARATEALAWVDHSTDHTIYTHKQELLIELLGHLDLTIQEAALYGTNGMLSDSKLLSTIDNIKNSPQRHELIRSIAADVLDEV